MFFSKNEVHPGLHEELKNKLSQANNLGFKVLRMANLGTVRTTEIPSEMYCNFANTEDFWSYAEKLAHLSEHIQSMKCGGYDFFELKNKLDFQNHSIQKILSTVDLPTRKRFPKTIAEWVDGEALSAHYAYDNAIFCSNDNARSAGRCSIFSKENIERIKCAYSIKVMSTNELAAILTEDPSN